MLIFVFVSFSAVNGISISSQDQDQDLFVMYTRGRPKSIFSFSAVNKTADENEIPFTAENEMKT